MTHCRSPPSRSAWSRRAGAAVSGSAPMTADGLRRRLGSMRRRSIALDGADLSDCLPIDGLIERRALIASRAAVGRWRIDAGALSLRPASRPHRWSCRSCAAGARAAIRADSTTCSPPRSLPEARGDRHRRRWCDLPARPPTSRSTTIKLPRRPLDASSAIRHWRRGDACWPSVVDADDVPASSTPSRATTPTATALVGVDERRFWSSRPRRMRESIARGLRTGADDRRPSTAVDAPGSGLATSDGFSTSSCSPMTAARASPRRRPASSDARGRHRRSSVRLPRAAGAVGRQPSASAVSTAEGHASASSRRDHSRRSSPRQPDVDRRVDSDAERSAITGPTVTAETTIDDRRHGYSTRPDARPRRRRNCRPWRRGAGVTSARGPRRAEPSSSWTRRLGDHADRCEALASCRPARCRQADHSPRFERPFGSSVGRGSPDGRSALIIAGAVRGRSGDVRRAGQADRRPSVRADAAAREWFRDFGEQPTPIGRVASASHARSPSSSRWSSAGGRPRVIGVEPGDLVGASSAPARSAAGRSGASVSVSKPSIVALAAGDLRRRQ